ncbi:hypothetical protein GCM10018771_69380 [Streptomyces cellulosae]|nr:hypothetical protein GCM10018771_69380 [Streptomyces cellulosae]
MPRLRGPGTHHATRCRRRHHPRTRPKDFRITPRDPDFDLYDNVGRDADQIHAARYNLTTRSDLKRWARRDAEPFRKAHPLPDQPWPAPRRENRDAAKGSPSSLLMTAASCAVRAGW